MATILVVDDRPSNRLFLTTLLGYGGHRLVEAGDGVRALELVRSDRPDLVITDILMPRMDGYEFVQQMRADPELAAMPVIFYTASYSAPEAQILARKCGVRKVLPKPSEAQEIVAAVSEVLGERMRTPKAPRAKAAETPLDTTLSGYFKELEEVKEGFRDLAVHNGTAGGRRVIKDLSGKFGENVAQMQRVTARLSALVEVGMEMIGERDPERLVKLFFSAACDLIESRYAAIGILDKDEKAFRHVYAKGFDAEVLRGATGRKGPLGTLLDGKPVRKKRQAKSSLDLLEGHPPVRDFLGIPVASADCVYGWMYFAESAGTAEFSEEDERLATLMAKRLALLYENALLYDEIQRHAARLQIEIGERRQAERALRESEERFRSLSMLSSDWFWEQDAEHRFVKFSGGDSVRGWGPDQHKAIGLHRWDLGGVIPISCSWEEHKGLLDAHKPFRNFEYQRVLGDGRLQYVEASGEPIFDATGRFAGYRGVATEITQRKGAENRIKRLNRVYAVLSGINTLIVRVRDRDELFKESCRIAVEQGQFKMAWIGVVDRGAMKIVPVASEGAEAEFLALFKDRFSLQEDSAIGQSMTARAVKEKKAIIANEIGTDARVLFAKQRIARGISSMAIFPLLVSGEAEGVLALYADEVGFFDEEEIKLLAELAGDIAFALDHLQKAEKINYLAYYDQLTGLANRTLFAERLGEMMRDAGGRDRMLAVSILDVERFKAINDAYGRQNGDLLLQEIAARMKAAGKEPTRMARISSDHFAVISKLAENEGEIARLTEKRLQEVFEAPFKIAGQDLRISARIGIAVFPQDGSDSETLLRSAEAAVKNAKESGERYLFFAQEMTARVADKLSLENKLRRAIEKEEFLLYYQPKVDLETRTVVAVEALIRWQTDKGLVPPLQFIPLLEETGLILQVGAWALKRAALDHRSWVERKLKAPRVAVNVSAIQLRQRDFVASVEQAIMDGIAPTAIDLEITESLVMEDIKGNIEKLKSVCDLGLSIAIDDFGTGYSSLAYLAQLPVQYLKIDRAFVSRMQEDPNAMTLVSTMISLAHSLRLKVIAEGVETEEQARFLRLLRCDQMQGYLFSKPLPADDLVKLLAKSG